MFDRVLSESEEVRSRNGIRVLPIPDRIGLLDNVGPCPGRRASDDRAVRNIRPDYFEFGAVSAVEDGTLVHRLCGWVYGGVIAPMKLIDAQNIAPQI